MRKFVNEAQVLSLDHDQYYTHINIKPDVVSNYEDSVKPMSVSVMVALSDHKLHDIETLMQRIYEGTVLRTCKFAKSYKGVEYAIEMLTNHNRQKFILAQVLDYLSSNQVILRPAVIDGIYDIQFVTSNENNKCTKHCCVIECRWFKCT